jgi:hypothetical protein
MTLPADQMPIRCAEHGAQQVHVASGPPWHCPVCGKDSPLDKRRSTAQQKALHAETSNGG